MSDSCGIVYFNRGTGCAIRLCVSISSLRRVYDGPVTVMNEGPLPPVLSSCCKTFNVEVHNLDQKACPVLLRKTQLWRLSPYDRTIYIDADTIVCGSLNELFAMISSNLPVVTWFTGWLTRGRRVAKRINDWTKVEPAWVTPALDYGLAINTGVMGWCRESSMLAEWEDLTLRGLNAGCARITIDELACQLLLPRHPHRIADPRYNTSGIYATQAQLADARVLHFHGKKHVANYKPCAIWKRAYWNLVDSLPHLSAELSDPLGDKRLRTYLATSIDAARRTSTKAVGKASSDREGIIRSSVVAEMAACPPKQIVQDQPARDGIPNDMTIVTVCDRTFIKYLKENMKAWRVAPGLREHPCVVFLIGLTADDPDVRFLETYGNVRTVEWRKPWSTRETALSAFVFGACTEVKTEYWLKLDADAKLVSDRFIWPNYRGAAITSHRWGYTRVKGDSGATRHWLNTLDDWWGGDPLFPPDIPRSARFRHPRICSFCSIEETAFTRRVADRCGERLPVPSQDTTCWYAATRWQLPVRRINMKRWMVH